MYVSYTKLIVVIVATVILSCCLMQAEGNYRKPPFNGSIFGKRGSSTLEIDNAGKALSAMCEIASEACQTWFPSQEK